MYVQYFSFFFSSRRRHTRSLRDWSSDVCSSDLCYVLRLDVPVPDVGAQHVAPLAVSGPLVPLGADRPLQAKPRGTRGVPEDADGVARGRAAVAPQEPPDLSFETRVLQRFARARDARPA